MCNGITHIHTKTKREQTYIHNKLLKSAVQWSDIHIHIENQKKKQKKRVIFKGKKNRRKRKKKGIKKKKKL